MFSSPLEKYRPCMSLVPAECYRSSIFFNISSSSNNNNSVSDSSISIINIYTRLCINSRWVVGICRMATRVLYRSLPDRLGGFYLSHSLRMAVSGPEVAKVSSIAAGRREKAAILIIIVVAAAVAVEAAAAAAAAAAVAVALAVILEHSLLGKCDADWTCTPLHQQLNQDMNMQILWVCPYAF